MIEAHFRLFHNVPQIYDTHFGNRRQSRTAAVCNKINDEVKTEFKKYKKSFAPEFSTLVVSAAPAVSPQWRQNLHLEGAGAGTKCMSQAPSSALYEYNFLYFPLSLTQFRPIGGTRRAVCWYAKLFVKYSVFS